NDPQILYYATGEMNNSGDSFAGTGVYKSIDAGRTWTLLVDDSPVPKDPTLNRLDNTQAYDGVSNPIYGLTVSKSAIDPTNDNIISRPPGTKGVNTPPTANAPLPGIYRYNPAATESKWFNLTSRTTYGRNSLNGQGTAPPKTPGPEDDYRMSF